MTDILPKNPYHTYEMPEHKSWQRGQDETMKVLRLRLENILPLLGLAIAYMPPSEVYAEAAENAMRELEQILEEINDAKS